MNRTEILEEAVHRCYKEMYAKAQPPADWDEILEKARRGEEDKNFPFYRQHYLSQEQYTDIINNYIYSYHISRNTKDHMDLVKDYFVNGGTKDKYIEEHDDEYGHHPGYRGYEKVAPLKQQMEELISDKYDLSCYEDLAEDLLNVILETLENCTNFYGSEHEECSFRFTVMNYSPTSNKQDVIDYWQSKGVDIGIKEYNPYEDE